MQRLPGEPQTPMDPRWREDWARTRLQASYVVLPPTTTVAPGQEPVTAEARTPVPAWAVVAAACTVVPALWMALGR